MSIEKTLIDHGMDPSKVKYTAMGNFYQVLKDGELLGYVLKEGWVWKPKARAK